MNESKYFADETDHSERNRLTELEGLFNPHTFEFLGGTGIGNGWRCLELGAGGGSVSRWLASRVGASGEPVALDLNMSQLAELK